MIIKFWCALLAGSLRARQPIVRSSARSWSSSTRWTALTFWDRWVLAASRVTLVQERDVGVQIEICYNSVKRSEQLMAFRNFSEMYPE
jgi:hypothetical protein